MDRKITSSEEEVQAFLRDLKTILNDSNFNVGTDLDILLKKKSESPLDPFTTVNTLLALDFDKEDIRKQLISLEVTEYLETFIDDLHSLLPPFFAFAKEIDSRDVYIKVKIRDKQRQKIFCVSFHFARYPFPKKMPYE